MSLAVTPDGKYAVVGEALGALNVLDLAGLATTEADPDALCLWAELAAGQRLHEGGGPVNLSADEWLDRWRTFRQQSSTSNIAGLQVDLKGVSPAQPQEPSAAVPGRGTPPES